MIAIDVELFHTVIQSFFLSYMLSIKRFSNASLLTFRNFDFM